MARPQKSGIDYFPVDVDMDQDDKISLLEAEHGIEGFGILIKLLMKIYKEGYFYEWTEKEQLLFSKRVNVDINRVNVVINSCLKWGFFDKTMFGKYRILTSSGIQKRYLEATSRRKKVEIVKEYCLVDINNYSNVVFVDIKGDNVDINEVNVGKKPIKKSKVKNIDDDEEESAEKNPYVFYEHNFGTISPFIAERIKALEEDIGPEMIIEAMKIARLNRATSFRYVETTVNDWLAKNIKTPEDLKAFEAEKQRSKNQKQDRPLNIDYEASAKSKYGW